MDASGNYVFKVLVVGCCAAGKTCCIRKVVSNIFNNEYKTTIGVDFAAKSIKLSHNGKEVTICIQFWDIAGQEYYSQLSRAYYKGAYGTFIVADLLSETLIQDIKIWRDEVKSKVFLPGTEEPVPIVLLGNKIDLPQARQVWENDNIMQQLDEMGFQAKFATSAVRGDNLDAALQAMAEKILESIQKTGSQQNQLTGVVMPEEDLELKKNKQCC